MITYALIKKGTESNPEFLVDYKHINYTLTPQFGILCGDILKMIIFFSLDAADYETREIEMYHKIPTEVFNLVTMEAVK